MKAIYIDGASLHHMGRALGIAQFRLSGLLQLLREKVGTEKTIFGMPVITVTDTTGKSTIERYTTAGFEVVKTTSKHSEDDVVIIERLRGLDPNVVREVVLVTADSDFSHELTKKVEQGMRVYWVGTFAHGPDNRPQMTKNLKPMFANMFSFVELQDFKDDILELPTKITVGPKTTPRAVKVELSGACAGESHAIASEITSMLGRKFPHIRCKIES